MTFIARLVFFFPFFSFFHYFLVLFCVSFLPRFSLYVAPFWPIDSLLALESRMVHHSGLLPGCSAAL
jgi:hypothetical protein